MKTLSVFSRMKISGKTTEYILVLLYIFRALYAWTMTTSKAKRYQPEAFGISGACSEDTDKNSTASRALMRIQNKLRGLDDISTGHSCVEGLIERLILDATNPSILNKLFAGCPGPQDRVADDRCCLCFIESHGRRLYYQLGNVG
jgi:hypothetical protein